MFVVSTDFDAIPYQLPSLTDHLTEFNAYVDTQEEIILVSLLGRKLYDDLITGLAGGPPDQKWLDISLGKEYTIANAKYKWEGLDKMLIPYIYRGWIKDVLIDSLTASGAHVPKAETAEVVSASRKVVKGFNDFAERAGHDRCAVKNTLYGFLRESGITYESSYVAAGMTSIQQYLDEYFQFPGRANVFNL